MKALLFPTFCLLVYLQAPLVQAQAYQWKDSAGRTVISDTPPPASIKGSRAVSSESIAPPAKSYAEKDQEFRKRQQDGREKADKMAKEETAAAERKDYCERAKRHLAALDAGERLVARDEKGDRRYLDDGERQQEIDRLRKNMADICK